MIRATVLACQAEDDLPALDPAAAAFTFRSVVHGAVGLALRRRVPFATIDPTAIAAPAVETATTLVAATARSAN